MWAGFPPITQIRETACYFKTTIMKQTIKYVLGVLALTAVLASCKKDENQITYESGTAPVLTATPLSGFTTTLRMADSLKPFMRLGWTNPNYRFTTGASSQDVNYSLQIDTTGANFSSPQLSEVSVPKILDSTFTVKAFNSLLANTLENIPHNFEFRIKASLGASSAVPLYSNVIKLTLTPYLDVAVPIPPTGRLYLTGDAMPSSWTNTPPATQEMTKKSTTLFADTVSLVPGKFYKFLSTSGQWQPQYGGKNADGGDLGYNMGLPGQSDPDGIPTPASAGSYAITVNFKTGKYTVVKL